MTDPLLSCQRPLICCLMILLGHLAIVFGCANPATDQRLVGRWNLDEAAAVANKIPSEENGATDSVLPQMELEFLKDGSLLTQTQINAIRSQKKGTWRIVQGTASSNLLTIECQLDGQTTTHEVSLSDGILEMAPPNMAGLNTKYRFRRILR